VYFALQEAAKYLSDRGRIVSISTAGTSQAMAGGGATPGAKRPSSSSRTAWPKNWSARHHGQHAGSGPDRHRRHGLEREQVAGLVAQTPLGRLGRPEDVADAVALLVSDSARWVTMQNVRATGGIV
jgi:3-oxoacyl-[acyl-carrier protein] reductase